MTQSVVAETTKPVTDIHYSNLQRLGLLVKLMRPKQWTKNGLLFAGAFFAGEIAVRPVLERTILAFIIFCLASSAIYIINDIADLEHDRQHPVKKMRPLASGAVSVPLAAMLLLLVAAGMILLTGLVAIIGGIPWHDSYASLGGGLFLFIATLATYIVLMIAYTYFLKNIVLLDVFVIATGFVLRAMAGAFIVEVPISPWFYLCTILLSLFLALGKRRHEIILLEKKAIEHRSILIEYNIQLLDQLMTIVTSATIMAYSLYTFESDTGNHRLMVTIPFVIYGVFRYLYLIHIKDEGGRPEEVLLHDRHIFGAVAFCIVAVILVLYVIPK